MDDPATEESDLPGMTLAIATNMEMMSDRTVFLLIFLSDKR
jgi:hypothetical protein